MNQVITDGLVLMPPAFSAGLGAWSRQDGTPGTDTWATAPNASLVAADADFGDCLEIVKTDGVIETAASTPVHAMPHAVCRAGLGGQTVQLHWPEPVRGAVHLTARCDT
jgi:hypothetical protein